jgi:hypothetical protein
LGIGSFDIKRGHFKNVEGGRLGDLLREAFGNVAETASGVYEATLGPLVVKAWLKGKEALGFESNQPTQVDDATATAIVRARNTFLEKATGFSAKERAKRAQAAVKAAAESGSAAPAPAAPPAPAPAPPVAPPPPAPPAPAPPVAAPPPAPVPKPKAAPKKAPKAAKGKGKAKGKSKKPAKSKAKPKGKPKKKGARRK